MKITRDRTFPFLIVLLLIMMAVGLNGCSLLQIPGQLISGTFSLLKGLLQVADKLPKPPPWMF